MQKNNSTQTTPMIPYAIKWVAHWFGQGLKLYLFALVALLVSGSLCLLPTIILSLLFEKLELTEQVNQALEFILITIGVVMSVAVFAAVLANQLSSQPLRQLESKSRN